MDINVAWAWLAEHASRWHDTWDIVGALGSAFAAGVALWLASRERTDRITAERDRDAAREAQRAAELAEAQREHERQARRVVIWVSRTVHRQADGPDERVYRVGFANYSDMPIMDVTVRVGETPAVRLNAGVRTFVMEPSIRPTETREGALGTEIAATQPLNDAIAVRFRDAGGTRWDRFADGRLLEVRTP